MRHCYVVASSTAAAPYVTHHMLQRRVGEEEEDTCEVLGGVATTGQISRCSLLRLFIYNEASPQLRRVWVVVV